MDLELKHNSSVLAWAIAPKGIFKMKKIIGMVSFLVVVAGTAAFAQGTAQAPTGYKCDDASIARMQTVASSMTDATKKAAAMKHMNAMKEAMAKKDMAACTTLLKDTENYFPNTAK
jgi:hypothetical protein